MNETQRLQRVVADLQRAPAQVVIYLEGKTDAEVFFALLGVPPPRDRLHDGVFVNALEQHSGGMEVRERVATALRNNIPGIFGILDGDGRALSALAAEFDPPHQGPLISFKAYCIENLLAKAAWPTTWPEPSWPEVLLRYSPYAALNRIHRQLQDVLRTLKIDRFTNPQHGQPLLTPEEVRKALSDDKHLLTTRDVESDFAGALDSISEAISTSLDEGHTLINGKWLVRHLARSVTKKSEDKCRKEWCAAVRSAGGLPEVRGLWQRIVGRAP